MIFSWARGRRRARKRRGPVSTRQRIFWVRLGSLGVVLLLMLRLFELQVVQNEFWEHQASLVRRRIEPIAAERGRILDRAGRVLATTRRSYDVVLDIERMLKHCVPLQMAEVATTLRLSFVPVVEVLEGREALFDELLATTPATLEAIEDPGLRSEARTLLQRWLSGTVEDSRALRAVLAGDDERPLASLLPLDRARLGAEFDAWVQRFTVLEEALGEDRGRLAACLDERRIQFLERWGENAKALHATSMPREDIARERVDWFRSTRAQATIFHADCPYDPIVPLLAMEPEAYDGIRAVARDRRDYPLPVAPDLIGMAHGPKDEQREEFRNARHEINRLRKLIHRTAADQARLDELVEVFRTEEYWPDDLVGHRGIEARFEKELRGERGYREAEWNRKTADTTASPEHKEAVPGGDVVLTLDAELQREAERVLGLTTLPVEHKPPVASYLASPRAAMVIVEVATGDLLVLASHPSWTREDYRERFLELAKREDRPLHEVAYDPYRVPVPGSLLKPIYALEAFLHGEDSPHRTVHCGGRFGTRGPRCNGIHGTTDLRESLERSCNIYYFELALRMGPYRLVEALDRFGFGRVSGAGIGGEERGHVPDPERVSRGALLNIAIGQGSVEATPLQIALAFAGVASGELPQARLVRQVNGVDLPVSREPLPYPPHALNAVHEGMIAACRGRGTAHVMEHLPPGFSMAGKTGTAQAGGSLPDHSWFAGFFPAHAPRYAICVFAENCGVGGGSFAAPLAVTFLRSEAARALLPEEHRR